MVLTSLQSAMSGLGIVTCTELNNTFADLKEQQSEKGKTERKKETMYFSSEI